MKTANYLSLVALQILLFTRYWSYENILSVREQEYIGD